MRTELEVVEDPAAVAAERLAEAAAKGARMVLTGGSTPRAAYERTAGLLDDWSAADLWFSDERCVPPDHEHSNFGLVERALLERIEGRRPTVHRMRGELGPEEGAAAYAAELAETFGDVTPVFDLMLLGVGPDAHICSLFPGADALGERERPAVGVATPGMAPLVARVTLTLPVVNGAREVLFLVTGEEKAEALARSFADAPDPGAPASLVDASATLLCDTAAAERLR